MAWRDLLTEWDRVEIEHAEYYASLLRHPIPEGDRLILIARLARLLDHATGSGVGMSEDTHERVAVRTRGRATGANSPSSLCDSPTTNLPDEVRDRGLSHR